MSRPATPAAVPVVSILLVACFALAAIPWLARARPGRHVNDKAAASHAAMSAGTAAMLLAML